jgi:hypothetical protein
MSKPKLKSPPSRIQLPELVDCDLCDKGFIEGLFHKKMPCDKCNGSGVLDKETGEAIPNEILIPAMRDSIDRLKSERADLKRQLAELKPDRNPQDPYPENMPKRHGGTHRMD